MVVWSQIQIQDHNQTETFGGDISPKGCLFSIQAADGFDRWVQFPECCDWETSRLSLIKSELAPSDLFSNSYANIPASVFWSPKVTSYQTGD